MARKGSWKHEFDVKYRRALNTLDNRIIDNANIIVLTATNSLDAMMKCAKSDGIWNPKTNRCKVEKYKKTLEDIMPKNK